MALILVHDVKHGRDRIINTENIFQCVQTDEGVRINYTEGSIGRDTCIVAGSLDAFAKAVGALRVG